MAFRKQVAAPSAHEPDCQSCSPKPLHLHHFVLRPEKSTFLAFQTSGIHYRQILDWCENPESCSLS